jgi:hypothetical protein
VVVVVVVVVLQQLTLGWLTELLMAASVITMRWRREAALPAGGGVVRQGALRLLQCAAELAGKGRLLPALCCSTQQLRLQLPCTAASPEPTHPRHCPPAAPPT